MQYLHQVHKGFLPHWSAVNFGNSLLNKVQKHTTERRLECDNEEAGANLPDPGHDAQGAERDATPKPEEDGH